MKKLKRIFALLLSALVLLSGCSMRKVNDKNYFSFDDVTLMKTTAEKKENAASSFSLRGCWLSFSELNPDRLTQEDAYRNYLKQLFQPLQQLSVTDLFVHVRPFADAIYPSVLFDESESVVRRRGDRLPFDFLRVILEESAAVNMRVHAWINPYRVLSDPAKQNTVKPSTQIGAWIAANNKTELLFLSSGVYLNPLSVKAQRLILDGVRELLETYDLAGVHVDDYFYPSDAGDSDRAVYDAYLQSGGALSLFDYRKAQVSALMRALYRTVKTFGADKLFSISPAAKVQENEQKLYADVRTWCSQKDYCDIIMPQLYFGFHNSAMPFRRAAKQWKSMRTEKSVLLCAGLAAYKVGQTDDYAGAGKDEWQQDEALLAKQVQLLQKLGYDGFCLFSASFVNFQKKVSRKAFQNLRDVL